MANNYRQATVPPHLPASLFSESELESLTIACGLSATRIAGMFYFFAEHTFCEQGDDESNRCINCTRVFQEKLKRLDPFLYPHIMIEGAMTCSKMREDEFGGFAYFITSNDVHS